MLTEDFFSAVSGPPLAPNASVSKEIGIYHHTLRPTYAVQSTFKKSAAPPNGLAVGESHVFAAQADKAHVHVYSRQRGNMEAMIPFGERIRCVALEGDVLLVGTAEGRLILWEVCTGRQVTTPACHVQAISCIASTPHHILTASEDSNVNVWSLPRLLPLDAPAHIEPEPERTLSSHRAAVTSIVASRSANPETGICVSASRDKTVIIWNYHTGALLRTLLFSAPPLCLALDPAGRALYTACEDSAIYLVQLFGPRALLGGHSDELPSTTVQVKTPLGVADSDAGPATCLAVSFDGGALLSGHPKGRILQWSLGGSGGHATELANLSFAVTNVAFVPLFSTKKPTAAQAVVKPTQANRHYTFTAQLDGEVEDSGPASTLDGIFDAQGFPAGTLEAAAAAMLQPRSTVKGVGAADAELEKERDEMWEIIREQRELQKLTFQKYVEAKGQ
jgi:pre-rRNA-processing protein IPI3